jgi:DNA-binding response OmpR family regulator
MLAMMLQLEGHEPRTASDGRAALAVAADFMPEVVLLDIGLPKMDGYELARRMRALPGLEGAVLVAMTGFGDEMDRQRSREAGLDHHLVKPVDPAEVVAVLRRRLKGR